MPKQKSIKAFDNSLLDLSTKKIRLKNKTNLIKTSALHYNTIAMYL